MEKKRERKKETIRTTKKQRRERKRGDQQNIKDQENSRERNSIQLAHHTFLIFFIVYSKKRKTKTNTSFVSIVIVSRNSHHQPCARALTSSFLHVSFQGEQQQEEKDIQTPALLACSLEPVITGRAQELQHHRLCLLVIM